MRASGSLTEVRTVSPRTLVIALAAVLAAGMLVFAGLLWWRLHSDGLGGFPDGAPGRASIVGIIPSPDATPLSTPVAAAISGDSLYVTEAGAGVVRVFGLDGQPRGSLAVPPAVDAPTAYPTDIAVLDRDTILVVDTSGQRVVALNTRPGADSVLEFVVGAAAPGDAPQQPTAVASDKDQIIVADGVDGTLRRYDSQGVAKGVVPVRATPPLSFVSGLSIAGSTMSVTDSTSGRVLSVDPRTGGVQHISTTTAQRPRGTAVDDDGRVWFADTIGRSATLLGSSLGETVLTVRGTEANPRANVPERLMGFGSPTDVVWYAARHRIYIVDSAAGRVKVFSIRR